MSMTSSGEGLAPLPPIPETLRKFWLEEVTEQAFKEGDPRGILSVVCEALEALRYESGAALHVRNALAPPKADDTQKIYMSRQEGSLAYAVIHLLDASRSWSAAEEILLTCKLHIDQQAVMHTCLQRQTLCIQQAGKLATHRLEINRTLLLSQDKQLLVFL